MSKVNRKIIRARTNAILSTLCPHLHVSRIVTDTNARCQWLLTSCQLLWSSNTYVQMVPPSGRTVKLQWLQKPYLCRDYGVHIQLDCDFFFFFTRVYKLRATTFCTVASTSCASSVWNFHSCLPSGALNFDVVARIMENLCTPVVMDDIIWLSVDVWVTAGESRVLIEGL